MNQGKGKEKGGDGVRGIIAPLKEKKIKHDPGFWTTKEWGKSVEQELMREKADHVHAPKS